MPKTTTPEREERLTRAVALVGQGTAIQAAARAEGVPYSTLRGRLKGERPVHDLPEQQPVVHDGLREIDATGAEVPVFIRDYSDRAKLSVYPIGDLHIGTRFHARKMLTEWLNYLEKTPGTSLLNTGDNLNCAIEGSVSDVHGEKLTVQEGRRQLTELFRPLAEADKLDAMIDGNHELRVYKRTGDSPNAAVADALGVNYAMSSCIVRYLVGDQSYDLYLRHGKGGGRKMGGLVNLLQDQENIIDADIYVTGHTHTQVAFPKNIFAPDGRGGYARRKRLFVSSGSFLAYEDYAAEAGYPPAHIGAPRINLDGSVHDMHASV